MIGIEDRARFTASFIWARSSISCAELGADRGQGGIVGIALLAFLMISIAPRAGFCRKPAV